MKTFCALCTLALASAAFDKLVTFDGVKKTSFDWHETNDPVMGGQQGETRPRCVSPCISSSGSGTLRAWPQDAGGGAGRGAGRQP